MTIANIASTAYAFPVAANSAHGIGVPESLGGHRLRAVFLCPQHGKPVMGGPCGASSEAPVSSGRYANLHGSAHPDWRRGGGVKTRTLEATAMTPRHTLTLNPSSVRASQNPANPSNHRHPSRLHANRHRRMALAALKLDSSLSVRLSRYWSHIEKARALEAVEVAQ